MGLVFDILAAPVALPTRGMMFIFNKIVEQVNNEMLDDGKVRMQLLELQNMLDGGQISEEEFYVAEEELLDRLDAILEFKENQQQQNMFAEEDEFNDDEDEYEENDAVDGLALHDGEDDANQD
jgi:hypothetical protein